MDWKLYENEIYEHFKSEYPSARITKDARVLGRYSKVERQIDLLIEDTIAGFHFRVVIDAKHRSRRIDVSHVEAFIGFCSDVGAQRGVLIAPKGHTKAAYHRAYNDESAVELDVLNFDELQQFQSHGAIPYSGSNGVLIRAPFGWIIDGTRRKGAVATLYQRGLDLKQAQRAKEWMYVNFWAKDAAASALEALVARQDADLRNAFPKATIKHVDAPHRDVGRTAIRHMVETSYPADEYTGFVEFDAFIVFCVMFTPPEVSNRNLRKLEYILRTVLPIGIKHAPAA